MAVVKGEVVANIYIRRLDNREIVETVPITNLYPRRVEQVVRGMLINLNSEEYFVDDSECWADMDELKAG